MPLSTHHFNPGVAGKEKHMSDTCRTCQDRIYHLDDCAVRFGGLCDCGLTDPSGKEWKCGDCESRRFHLSSCAVFNEPAYPAGDCDCGLKSLQGLSE